MNGFFLYRHAWIFSFQPHQEPHLTKGQQKTLLRNGGLMVRNTFDFDQKEKSEFWYLIKDSFGGLAEHSSNERNKIRRSLKSYDIILIDIKTYREEAFQITKAAYKDYRVSDRKMSMSIFNKYIDQCERDNFNYWGIFEKESGQLAGFSTVKVWPDACQYDLTVVRPENKHNSTYPFYGLFYKMNEHYLGELQLKYVSDGTRSITEHSNIQQYLEQNFKFRKAYCKLEVRYKWWFGIIVNALLPFERLVRNINAKAVLKMHKMQSE
ncbi:MAG: hypothetical protein ACI358_05445 [Candidatus Limimorpha sp.]